MREKAQGYVMLYEMLLGKGTIQGGGKLKVRPHAGSTGTTYIDAVVGLPCNCAG